MRPHDRWTSLLVIVLVAVGVLASVWVQRDNEELRGENRDLHAVVGALSAQVEGLGGEPLVDAPPLQGIEGERGAEGRDGRDGRNGIDGGPGLTPPCYFAPTQCVGAPGRDGIDGQDGTDGVDGADSTVPGPKGDKGDPGPAGTPCPEGYSWQTDTLRGDDVVVCTRDAA